MATTVAQHQQSSFSTPAFKAALDSSVVRANLNAIGTTLNAHDSDAGIHLQSSSLAARPAAGVAGRKWFTDDGLRLYYDNGTTWSEAAYLPLAAGGTVTGNVTIAGNLTINTGTITGTLAAGAQPNITALTATSISLGGDLTLTGASRKIIPGTTSLVVRNVGDSKDAIKVEAADLRVGDATGGQTYLGHYAMANNATSGFPVMPKITDAPTGSPGVQGAYCYDDTNHRIYVRGTAGWRYIATVAA